MPKDNIHHGGWEHRDVHNVNGMLFVSVFAYYVAEFQNTHTCASIVPLHLR